MKTSELNDIQLDYAVTMVEDPEAIRYGVADWREQRRNKAVKGEYVHRYHQSWAQSGPIIERERIAIDFDHDVWNAAKYGLPWFIGGPTPLIAAMRCYVASKLGEEVEIPEELI